MGPFPHAHVTSRVASLRRMLRPSSVAVVADDFRRGGAGRVVFDNLLDGFHGPVFPVDPHAPSIGGVRAYATLQDIASVVDLVLIATSAPRVIEVAAQCADVDAAGVVVLSPGFAEAGPEGLRRQELLVEILRAAGIRLVGPNCLGILDDTDDIGLHALTATVATKPGRVALMAQSGAIGLAAINAANAIGLGISSFVSPGNSADVGGTDLLEYWGHDPATRVITLYIEAFDRPREFGETARRVARRKPIVVVKSGRTRAGWRAVDRHTGALPAGDGAVDALFRRSGIIRVDTVEEMVDVAAVLEHGEPSGPRVAVVSNSGGVGVMGADAVDTAGLTLAELSGVTRQRLRTVLPSDVRATNPLCLPANAHGADYEAALSAVLADGGVDIAVAVFAPTMPSSSAAIAAAVDSVAVLHPQRTVVGCFPGIEPGVPGHVQQGFPSVERALKALGRAARHAEWLSQPLEPDDAFVVDRAGARDAIEGVHGWVPADRCARLLGAYGITTVTSIVADDLDAALVAADTLGCPVAVKAQGFGDTHRSDFGAVRLDLRDAEAIAGGVDAVRAASHAVDKRVLVQPMVPGGIETVVNVVHDTDFGPVVSFGVGGVVAELLGDRSYCALPMTGADADAMIAGIGAQALLGGHRGRVPVDREALKSVLLRVACLAQEMPELIELRLDPVVASPNGAVVIDARARVGARR